MATDLRTRRSDVALVALLSAAGIYLMVGNIGGFDGEIRVDSDSWLMVPAYLLATLPLLWWRRNPLLAAVVVTAAMAVHVLAFGWQARCGSGLPLAWVAAYWIGTRDSVRRSLAGLAVVEVLMVLVLVRDSAAGLEILPVTGVLAVVVWGVGRLVRHRSALADELRLRTAELAELRDRRAELDVSDDRARMSAELDTLLQERLGQLSRAASPSTEGLDPDAARALMAGIEAESRQTLSEMRDIVGVLRGGEASLAPAPSVAHLDALLARWGRSGATLVISGSPRPLPASVELSAYRIVEHLLGALGGESAPVEVRVAFDDDALEIRMSGPVHRGADLRGAVARARERARLQEGTLNVKVSRGLARAVAQVPLPVGAR